MQGRREGDDHGGPPDLSALRPVPHARGALGTWAHPPLGLVCQGPPRSRRTGSRSAVLAIMMLAEHFSCEGGSPLDHFAGQALPVTTKWKFKVTKTGGSVCARSPWMRTSQPRTSWRPFFECGPIHGGFTSGRAHQQHFHGADAQVAPAFGRHVHHDRVSASPDSASMAIPLYGTQLTLHFMSPPEASRPTSSIRSKP